MACLDFAPFIADTYSLSDCRLAAGGTELRLLNPVGFRVTASTQTAAFKPYPLVDRSSQYFGVSYPLDYDCWGPLAIRKPIIFSYYDQRINPEDFKGTTGGALNVPERQIEARRSIIDLTLSFHLISDRRTTPFAARFAEPIGRLQAQNTGADGATATRPATNAATSFTYSLVANGKSTGDSFVIQVLDPTGKVKTVRVPEGTVLEALMPGAAKPLAAGAGGNVVTQTLDAFCLEFHKLPPKPGTIYRIADPATQQKFQNTRFVMEATREMFQAKKLHPIGDPKGFGEGIRQYALWTKLENWGKYEFTQNIIERTKKNAEELHVSWTAQMESGLRAVIPGMWSDVSQVLDDAKFLEQLSNNRGQARQQGLNGNGRNRATRAGQ